VAVGACGCAVVGGMDLESGHWLPLKKLKT
jgi:hypothetical protein